jgi:chaperonin GroEL
VASLLSDGAAGRYLIVHPPEYGHWRKALLEDMAILTGGRVIARDPGGRVEDVTEDEFGGALRVKTTASLTAIIQPKSGSF